MQVYETVFIVRQDLSDAQVQELTSNCEALIKDQKGKILKTENWGLRTLAYKIKKNRKGHYVLIEHESEGPALHELERTLRLNEDVLRYISIKLKEPTKEESAILKFNNDYDKEAA